MVIDILYDLYTSWIWNYHLGWHQVCLKFKCVPNNLSHSMYELWTSVCYVQGWNSGIQTWTGPGIDQTGMTWGKYQPHTRTCLVGTSGHTSLIPMVSSIYLPHTRQKWALDPNTFSTRLVWFIFKEIQYQYQLVCLKVDTTQTSIHPIHKSGSNIIHTKIHII